MQNFSDLDLKAKAIRRSIIEMLTAAGSGHTAGPLGMADVFTALYFSMLKHDPTRPDWSERDRLFLSNGHICPVRYAAMAHAGYFPVSELQTLRKLGSRLQGHPERERLPGIENTSGPLGDGLGQAVGCALAARLDRQPWYVYCAMSDGEQDAGLIWEAAMLAGKEKLSHLIGIIDRNHIQIDGDTERIMPLEPLADKWRAFNWHVLEVNGHDIDQIIATVRSAKQLHDKPIVIIAHTTPGKGVKSIEGDYRWHGMVPNTEQSTAFLEELEMAYGRDAGSTRKGVSV